MRIGIEAQRVFRAHKHGMDFVVLQLIRNLQEMDKENEYFIFVNDGPDKNCISETENFKIVRFGAAYAVWEQWLLPKYAKKYRIELLHCTSNTAPLYCPVPLVITIHDIIYMERSPFRERAYTAYQKFGNMYRRLLVKKLLSRAEVIITVSAFEKSRFHSLFSLPGDKVRVVYNGVGDHFRKISDKSELERVRSKYGLPERFILFLGNTDPKKNTFNTVLAFASYCRDYGKTHKLLIGDIDPGVIKQMLVSQDMEEYFEQIRFTGYIDNQDLPAIMNMAALFLYPSKRESFGLPVLEGMASGTAVIAANTSSMPEIGGDAAYYVDPLKVEEMARGIGRLLKDDDLRSSLIENGLKRAKLFSWKNTAAKTLNIYREILQ